MDLCDNKEIKDNKVNYTVELKNTGFASGNPQVIAAVYTDGMLKWTPALKTSAIEQNKEADSNLAK